MKQSQNKFTNSIGLHGVDEKTGVSFPNLKKFQTSMNLITLEPQISTI